MESQNGLILFPYSKFFSQIRGMDVEGSKKDQILQGVSFEVRGGEILAVMSTTGNNLGYSSCQNKINMFGYMPR